MFIKSEIFSNSFSIERNSLILVSIIVFSLLTPSLYASMCSSHSSDENESTNKISYSTPCEISDTVLMASSEEVCMSLKEKISNHDHD